MSNDKNVISGPEEDYDIPRNGSIGKYIMDCLKRRGRHEIINIDAFTDEKLTCGQLLDEVVQLIHLLEKLEIKKGDVITLMSENSIRYCVPIVASFYLGVVLNLIHSSYSTGELKHALLISKPKLVLCSYTCLPNVQAVKKECNTIKQVLLFGRKPDELVIDNGNFNVLQDMTKTMPTSVNNIRPAEFDGSKHGALILLSSGTSGLPKGVLLTHENLRIPIGLISDSRFAAATTSDVVAAFLPFSHVFGVIGQFSAVVNSNILVIMKKFQPEVFLQAISQYKITILPLVPPIAVFLTKHPIVKKFDISSITYIISAAAPLGKDIQDEMTKLINTAAISQIYGTTEVSGTIAIVARDLNKPGSVGKLIPNIQLKVWDVKNKETVGPNKIGEFWVKGPTVMKEYIGIPTTDDIIDKDGFYHTGDVGYYDEEGFLYLVERITDLIKYKGFQVPPSELENILLTHPMIKDCAVIGIPNEIAGEVPLAYVVPQNDSNLTQEKVIKYVADRISAQKRLHGGVKFVDVIPRSAAGKLLRRKLLEIYLDEN